MADLTDPFKPTNVLVRTPERRTPSPPPPDADAENAVVKSTASKPPPELVVRPSPRPLGEHNARLGSPAVAVPAAAVADPAPAPATAPRPSQGLAATAVQPLPATTVSATAAAAPQPAATAKSTASILAKVAQMRRQGERTTLSPLTSVAVNGQRLSTATASRPGSMTPWYATALAPLSPLLQQSSAIVDLPAPSAVPTTLFPASPAPATRPPAAAAAAIPLQALPRAADVQQPENGENSVPSGSARNHAFREEYYRSRVRQPVRASVFARMRR